MAARFTTGLPTPTATLWFTLLINILVIHHWSRELSDVPNSLLSTACSLQKWLLSPRRISYCQAPLHPEMVLPWYISCCCLPEDLLSWAAKSRFVQGWVSRLKTQGQISKQINAKYRHLPSPNAAVPKTFCVVTTRTWTLNPFKSTAVQRAPPTPILTWTQKQGETNHMYLGPF